MEKTEELARQTLKNNRVAIFLVAYNAEKHITKVLQRIPSWVAQNVAEIYVIDDSSSDKTVSTAKSVQWPVSHAPLKVYRTPYNQGYGGNQRLGYLYAIERQFDIVVLLHADGQYAPEALPDILAPYSEGADAVFGSRFKTAMGALKGKMPLYKFVGNRILTRMQNFILDSKMSEMHSGYRSYRTSALKKVPFVYNSLGFDFDADIIVQFLARKLKIVEVPIPTFYGDEICHVNGMEYAWKCLKTAIKFRLMKFEIFYDPKFDFVEEKSLHYPAKMAETSLHHYIRELGFEKGSRVLEISDGTTASPSQDADRNTGNTKITTVPVPRGAFLLESPQANDVVLALDVIEHMVFPEQAVGEIFKNLRSGGRLYASTGNIGFFLLRFMHFFGQFNYGRRGILDLTHHRLFTVSSFRRLLENAGFKVDQIMGFGPPIRDAAPNSMWAKLLDKILYKLAQMKPSLFAFQILIVCSRTDSVAELMRQSFGNELAPQMVRETADSYGSAEPDSPTNQVVLT